MKYAQNDTFGPVFGPVCTNFSLKTYLHHHPRRQILKASNGISLETAQNASFGHILACVQLRHNRSFVPAGLSPPVCSIAAMQIMPVLGPVMTFYTDFHVF